VRRLRRVRLRARHMLGSAIFEARCRQGTGRRWQFESVSGARLTPCVKRAARAARNYPRAAHTARGVRRTSPSVMEQRQRTFNRLNEMRRENSARRERPRGGRQVAMPTQKRPAPEVCARRRGHVKASRCLLFPAESRLPARVACRAARQCQNVLLKEISRVLKRTTRPPAASQAGGYTRNAHVSTHARMQQMLFENVGTGSAFVPQSHCRYSVMGSAS